MCQCASVPVPARGPHLYKQVSRTAPHITALAQRRDRHRPHQHQHRHGHRHAITPSGTPKRRLFVTKLSGAKAGIKMSGCCFGPAQCAHSAHRLSDIADLALPIWHPVALCGFMALRLCPPIARSHGHPVAVPRTRQVRDRRAYSCPACGGPAYARPVWGSFIDPGKV